MINSDDTFQDFPSEMLLKCLVVDVGEEDCQTELYLTATI